MTKYLLALALLFSLPSAAQIHKSQTDSIHYNLNPIVVTGSGHHQRMKSTATPVRMLSSKELGEQGITTFDAAITRLLPQASLAPNSMGTFLRLNGLGNKYILILINGQKLTGDISGNVDLNRINMSRVKRIEVLDGAASSLYGSDAIAGVINIITDQPTDNLISIESDTRVSGKGQLTESVNLDIFKGGFGSYTTYIRDQADSYHNNPLEYVKGSDTETQKSIAPLFTGYNSDLLSQKFTFSPNRRLAINAGLDYTAKTTERPNSSTEISGGTDYEMRYRGLRWTMGGIYKFNRRNSVQADFTSDWFKYGKEYDVETKSNHVGDYVQSKRQHTTEGQIKGILGLTSNSTTIVGGDWRRDALTATSGDIRESAYILAAYGQHEMRFADRLTATIGARLDYHEQFEARFTPKASVMYTTGDFNLRATYSAGFRAPGLDELHYRYYSVNRGKPQIIFGNKDLEPEKSNYWSLNAEYRTNKIAVGVTGYVNRIKDMVVRQNIEVDDHAMDMLRAQFPEMTDDEASKLERYSQYQNSDRGLVEGIQANVSANLFRGFNLTANYAWTYARTKSGDKWTVLDRSIRNTATLAANYRHTWNKYTLNLNLNGRFQSKTYYDGYENAPGFGIWNIHSTHSFTGLKWADIEPSVGIDNIFDKADRRIDSSKHKVALYSPGRMVVVGLKLRFKH